MRQGSLSDGQRPSRVTTAVVFLVRLYRMGVSPLLGRNCRFEPTCSQYMTQALSKHGVLKGLFLGLRRVLRCHPLSKGGYDPVP
ncbi:MAG: membrane protein insertion efficiency factor YidD [Planctomycetes bacterium]|nr:membrane protein insertion efficiency factor YidD [Planctomycetota bacterium]